MRKFTIGVILLVLLAAFVVPTVIAAEQNNVIVTYGETTYNNHDYKNIVDQYFSNSTDNFNNASVKVITASQVNNISSGISHNTYNSNQIFSCALVDINGYDQIEVDVDTSKITTITPSMYQSALESAGITRGHVVVTSPVTATGESALAGVMNCYEQATNTTIPEDVQAAATNEIVTQAEIVNSSNVDPDKLSDTVKEVKDEVISKNITDPNTVKEIVNETADDNGVNLTSEDVDKLTDSVLLTQSVQDSANQYKQQLNNAIDDKQESFIDWLFGIFGF